MKKTVKKIFYLFFPLVIGSLIGFIISNKIDYSSLIKPPFSPPKIVFPIAWSIIYFLMGLSYFILKNNDNSKKTNLIYYIQLFVNALWSIIFFYFKLRFPSCIWIILLDILVIIMINNFYKINKISAYLNIPYLLWILFATYLTIGIYILN